MGNKKDPTIKERLFKLETCINIIKKSTDEIKQDVKDLRKIILGNGQDGITGKILKLEEKEERQFKFTHAITIAIVSTLIGGIAASIF